MKLKALLVAALFVLGVTAAVAVAKPPPGKGKPAAVAAKQAAKLAARAAKLRASELKCRGGHMNLAGTVGSIDLAQSEFDMTVEKANKKGRDLVDTSATIVVGDKTKMRRNGKSSLDKLAAGDHVKVLVRTCRDAEGDAALMAKQVVARGPESVENEGTESTSTSTSTETDTTMSTETETTTDP